MAAIRLEVLDGFPDLRSWIAVSFGHFAIQSAFRLLSADDRRDRAKGLENQ